MMPRVLALILMALLVVSVARAASGDVLLLSSSEDGVVLRYVADEVDVRSVSASGADYVSVLLPGSEPLGVPGAPDLPVVRVIVGVPECDGIDMSVSTGPETAYDGVRVIPSPSVVPVGEGEVSDYRFVEGEQYRQRGLWPSGAAAMGPPGMLATQRVVEIEIHPCLFDPVANGLTLYASVDVSLSFRGVRASGGLRADSPRREKLFETALLNYESARAWRVSPASRTTVRDARALS
jgi:hypothetical protein